MPVFRRGVNGTGCCTFMSVIFQERKNLEPGDVFDHGLHVIEECQKYYI